MKKIIAFTLAETLIVMGIIGIVSALTLPNLNSSTGDKEKVAKVKKIYQNLDDAFSRAQSVYGPLEEWFPSGASETDIMTRFGERITEFMKVSKNCALAANAGCFSKQNMKYTDGRQSTVSYETKTNVYKIILADGTSVAFMSVGHVFYVDIDGPNKGPNTIGKDIFSFEVSDNSVVPKRPSNFSDYISGDDSVVKNGTYTSGWVVDFDNMDYLKAGTDGKCKNSNVTLNPAANPPVISCK